MPHRDSKMPNTDTRPKTQRKPRLQNRQGRRIPSVRPPSMQSPKLYETTTDIITLPSDMGANTVIYSSLISPTFITSQTNSSSQLRADGSNTEKYKFTNISFHFGADTSTAVFGHEVTMFWQRDAVEAPTDISVQTVRQQPYKVALKPGRSGSLKIPSMDDYKYVDPANVSAPQSMHGMLIVVVHGTPTFSAREGVVSSGFGTVTMRCAAEFSSFSPGNIPPAAPGIVVIENATLSAVEGEAVLSSPSLLALSNAGSTSTSSNPIMQVLLAAGDVVSAALPPPFNLLAKVGLFFVRKITGNNGAPTFKIYKSLTNALTDRGQPLSGTYPLGEVDLRANVICNGYGAHTNPPPAFSFDFVSGQTILMEFVALNSTVVGTNFPIQNVQVRKLTDLSTKATTSDIPTFPNWKLNGNAPTLETVNGHELTFVLKANVQPVAGVPFYNGLVATTDSTTDGSYIDKGWPVSGFAVAKTLPVPVMPTGVYTTTITFS